MTTPIAYNLADAAAMTGLSATVLRRAAKSRALPAKRSGENGGGRFIFLHTDLVDWLEGLDDA